MKPFLVSVWRRLRGALGRCNTFVSTRRREPLTARSRRHVGVLARPSVPSEHLLRMVLPTLLISLALFTLPAHAAMTATGLWTEVKNFFFSEWSLVIGVLVIAIAVAGIPRWGVIGMWAGVACAVIFFLIPGAVVVMQNWGKTLA